MLPALTWLRYLNHRRENNANTKNNTEKYEEIYSWNNTYEHNKEIFENTTNIIDDYNIQSNSRNGYGKK